MEDSVDYNEPFLFLVLVEIQIHIIELLSYLLMFVVVIMDDDIKTLFILLYYYYLRVI